VAKKIINIPQRSPVTKTAMSTRFPPFEGAKGESFPNSLS